MISLLAALIVFSLIVLFHEFGHFLLAKRGGICVVEFSLGMGPRLFSFVKGGTRYSLKLLPFGGSCMMLGEDEGYDAPGETEKGSSCAQNQSLTDGKRIGSCCLRAQRGLILMRFLPGHVLKSWWQDLYSTSFWRGFAPFS